MAQSLWEVVIYVVKTIHNDCSEKAFTCLEAEGRGAGGGQSGQEGALGPGLGLPPPHSLPGPRELWLS